MRGWIQWGEMHKHNKRLEKHLNWVIQCRITAVISRNTDHSWQNSKYAHFWGLNNRTNSRFYPGCDMNSEHLWSHLLWKKMRCKKKLQLTWKNWCVQNVAENAFDYCNFWSLSFLQFPLRCLRENKLERFQNMILVFGPIWSQRGQTLQWTYRDKLPKNLSSPTYYLPQYWCGSGEMFSFPLIEFTKLKPILFKDSILLLMFFPPLCKLWRSCVPCCYEYFGSSTMSTLSFRGAVFEQFYVFAVLLLFYA